VHARACDRRGSVRWCHSRELGAKADANAVARDRGVEEVEEVEVVVAGEQSPRPLRKCEVAGAVAGNQVTKLMPILWRATVRWSRSARRSVQPPRKCVEAGTVAGNQVTKPMPMPWRATVRWSVV